MSITFDFEDKNGDLVKLDVNQNIFYFFADAKKVGEFEAKELVYKIINNFELGSNIPTNINQLECELLDQIRRSTINACIG